MHVPKQKKKVDKRDVVLKDYGPVDDTYKLPLSFFGEAESSISEVEMRGQMQTPTYSNKTRN